MTINRWAKLVLDLFCFFQRLLTISSRKNINFCHFISVKHQSHKILNRFYFFYLQENWRNVYSATGMWWHVSLIQTTTWQCIMVSSYRAHWTLLFLSGYGTKRVIKWWVQSTIRVCQYCSSAFITVELWLTRVLSRFEVFGGNLTKINMWSLHYYYFFFFIV